ncbi:MAG TPA: minor capsid protein [Rummeliibacillus sp.]|nr:minor capsid protein [Rummeliibacillus sp.]
MDIVDRLADKLEQELNLFTTISIDVLKSDDNAITIRHVPSSPNNMFMDKTYDIELVFQTLVKHIEQQTTIQAIEAIQSHIEKLNALPSNDSSYEFIKAEQYVTPTLLEIDERNCYIYTAMFKVNIHVN